VSRAPSEQDEQRRKAEAAHARLARHERLSRIALRLILLLCTGLLILVVMFIWNIRGH
jgi:hypothetical protein